ncbi:DUF1176 domain-containing protein [Sphingomonas desiccabilis]|uniref:DUF1176 domain-containing protein n=1 Tax=Sphingomonas desiccabilis TaxID=429134 RepID=A0A4Q2ITF0_9SPHN|nr:DUF1176 domain-containing protein [Sphingomonas desiccabilis]MBB3911440.1 hypothetical protein [Sphingomonas desiccabilis]RXZ31787.1 DUF1176 domain-containing protein [Sphingomonas desiccabilis]
MHRLPLLACLLLLPLAGCGNDTSPSAPQPGQTAAAPQPLAQVPQQADADSHMPPKPGETRTFRDWVAGCDNGLACRAVALAPDDEIQPALMLTLDRAAGPGAVPTLQFIGQEERLPPLTISVDGTQLAKGGTAANGAVQFEGSDAERIASALGNGRRLTVTGSGGETIGAASLSGAAAALRWIDERQGRAGTSGALVARGNKADAAPAPALPVIRAAQARGEAALLDPARVAAMKREAGCETDRDLGRPQTKPLGDRTLVLLPCSSGAYNLMMAVFTVRDGKHTPAQFDAPSGMSEDGSPIQNVVDGSFENEVLTSFARGRGLGDCGIRQEFVWDGSRFRLSRQEEMPECRGSKVYLPTWRARVVR